VSKLLTIALLILLMPVAAHAQQVPTAQGVNILTALQAATNTWIGPLVTISTELLGGLAVITFVLAVGFSFLQQGDVVDMLAIALRMVIYFGFWQFMISNWPTFGHAIIASFQTAASRAGAIPSSPTDVINMGINLGMHMLSQTSGLHPIDSAELIVVAFLIVGMYCFVAALMLLSLAKAYIVIAAGALFLGFAGSFHTLDIAMNVPRMTIAAGGRLFAIQLIASVGATILRTWAGESTALNEQGMLAVFGLSVVYVVLVFSIPASIEHMAGGTGHAHAGPGALFRAAVGAVSAGNSVAAAARSILGGGGSGGGGGSSLPSRSGGGVALPPPGNTAGGASAATSGAGTRMQPPGARYTP
jgi:type IV secretion system protein TrbL